MKLHEEIQFLMEDKEYTWNFGGEARIPTADEVKEVLDKAYAALYDGVPGSTFEFGRLIIRHYDANKFDVYLHIGEENDYIHV